MNMETVIRRFWRGNRCYEWRVDAALIRTATAGELIPFKEVRVF